MNIKSKHKKMINAVLRNVIHAEKEQKKGTKVVVFNLI
jgi:hypothetical protein